MNYTENYQLPQWEESDRVLREDFNTAMTKAENALNKKCQITYGCYVGTNQYGKDHPCVLEFPFPPQIIIITQVAAGNASDYVMFLREQTQYAPLGSPGGVNCGVCTWKENMVSWYSENSSSTQFNYSTRYIYLAIG